MSKKIFIMVTAGPDNAERATIPFAMATAAQASDAEVTVGLQADGVFLATKAGADGVAASHFPPLADLVEAYLEAGGRFLVCGPCVQSRRIDPKADLVEAATVVGGVTFIDEAISAHAVFTY